MNALSFDGLIGVCAHVLLRAQYPGKRIGLVEGKASEKYDGEAEMMQAAPGEHASESGCLWDGTGIKVRAKGATQSGAPGTQVTERKVSFLCFFSLA